MQRPTNCATLERSAGAQELADTFVSSETFLEPVTMVEKTPTPEEKNAIRIRNEIISKWGADTISMFTKNVKSYTSSDLMCCTALSVCSTYSNAIMTLLEKGWRMPSKALLRVLFEASAKVLWCLNEGQTDAQNPAVEDKIQQWAKNSLMEELKLREKIAEITSGVIKKENERVLQKHRERLTHLTCKKMPGFVDITRQLNGSWHQQLYVRLYAQFLNAVHLDLVSLGEMAKDDGHTVSVTYDSDESIDELAQYCLLDMHILFFTIRSHYGWDTGQMANEFKATGGSLTTTNKEVGGVSPTALD